MIPDQTNSWINSQKHILTLLTTGGIAVILLWPILDLLATSADMNWIFSKAGFTTLISLNLLVMVMNISFLFILKTWSSIFR